MGSVHFFSCHNQYSHIYTWECMSGLVGTYLRSIIWKQRGKDPKIKIQRISITGNENNDHHRGDHSRPTSLFKNPYGGNAIKLNHRFWVDVATKREAKKGF